MTPLLLISTHYTLYCVRHGRLEKHRQFALEETEPLYHYLSKSSLPVRILDWQAQASILRIPLPTLNRRDTSALAAHHLQQHFPGHPYVGWRAHQHRCLYPQALHPSPALLALLAHDTAHTLLLAGLYSPAQLSLPTRAAPAEAPPWQLLQWQTRQGIWSVLHEAGIPAFCQRDHANAPDAMDIAAQRIRQHAVQQGWFAQDAPLSRTCHDLGEDEQNATCQACLIWLAQSPPKVDHLPRSSRRYRQHWQGARMFKRIAGLVLLAALTILAKVLVATTPSALIAPLAQLSPEEHAAWQAYEQDWALWTPAPPTPYVILDGIAQALASAPLPLRQLAWQPVMDDQKDSGTRILLQFEQHDEAAFVALAQRLKATPHSSPHPSLEYTWASP